MAKTTQGINRESVREVLKLAAWQVDLAAEAGLIGQHTDGSYTTSSVDLARDSIRSFRRKLELEYRITAADAARRISCSLKEFNRLAAERKLTVVGEIRGKHGKTLHYRTGDVDALRTDESIAVKVTTQQKTVPVRGRAVSSKPDRTVGAPTYPQLRTAPSSRSRPVSDAPVRSITDRRAPSIEAETVASNVTVNLRNRGGRPVSVTLHLGPTNSGKTYDALNRLAATGSGVYAAPLRMLAREAYTKLVEKIGADNVGLITGEEQINPTAAVICCTVEMAPMSGTTLVVDEAHWAADAARGYAWTRLLVGGSYEQIEVAANRGAEQFLTAVLADADYLNIEYHDRLSPLTFGGQVRIADIPNGSLVVAFSRKAVHALAQRIIASGRTVGALYGALPPETRVAQINKFMTGEVDVLVCTDVIGHGINSPANAVVIAQTDKFDGQKVRDLLTWELAQISGRAGRFGHAGAGQVFALAGEAGFNPKKELIAHGANAAAGRCSDGLIVTHGLIRPTFADLGSPDAHQIGVALASWSEMAEEAFSDRDGVEAVPVGPIWERWIAIADMLGANLTRAGLSTQWELAGYIAWQVVTTPIDLESPVLPAMVMSLSSGADRFEPVLRTIRINATGMLDAAETAASSARDLMVVARMFPEIRAGLWEESAALESLATKTISKKLASSLKNSSFGVCADCGSGCVPNFTRCDRCHVGQRRVQRAA
jgi:ATP-dependent RNA helicase SUPV3L1/SUV3